jgi:serine/threonine protein phosphatase PrpC
VADLTHEQPMAAGEGQEHVLGPKGSLLLVADGMGGAAAGEVASEMVAEVVYTNLVSALTSPPNPRRFAECLREALVTANSRIHAYAAAHPEAAGMGSTATLAGVLGPDVYVAQVGDSRAYLVRRGVATQLTQDQSLTRHLVETGRMTPEEAERSQDRNVILQALGPSPSVDVVVTRQGLRVGDAVLLCSDGLTGFVDAAEIAEVVGSTPDLSIACDELVELANARGGRDNITVVVARFDGPGLKDPPPGDGRGDPQVVP